jgi:hypothetical protein
MTIRGFDGFAGTVGSVSPLEAEPEPELVVEEPPDLVVELEGLTAAEPAVDVAGFAAPGSGVKGLRALPWR